ncbi:hypothetical protein [Terricaulis silvestris]|uniref:Uncharacterized protein n=1 Tax=Terricaulis silvestris TaxID=2686094 RepID=A0A6I6MIF7_9CAUL|nr:hypothetical protein [Terricaulis silvestris]QGZ94870.1 hypothetical protein DSM104635_01702 [Terricaulis silvestris]
MSQKKDLKRAVKAIWDEVKTLRSEQGKRYAPEEIEVAAAELGRHAKDLRLLSQRMSALSAMPPKPAKPKKKASSAES